MYQAADTHVGAWPAGVRVRAVFTLGPVRNGADGYNQADTLVTTAAVAGMTGSCDFTGDSAGYYAYESGRTTAGLYDFSLVGGDHDYFNTQWSPESGQVMASDDAVPVPGAGAGRCKEYAGGGPTGGSAVELTEARQRAAAVVYVTAYFRRYLLGDAAMNPVLTGACEPLGSGTVNVRAQP
jgi:hypothetical protein